MTIGFALLGAGRIGKVHAAAIAATPRIHLTAVADAFAEPANELAAVSGAEVRTIDAIMVADDIDAVDIVAPNHLHAEMAVAALEAGKHVLLEKPMATTVEALVAQARAGDAAVMIDVNCRPLVVPDREPYVARVERVLRLTDVVKVSDEDLAYLRPGRDPLDAARDLLAVGPRAVLLTAGGGSVTVLTGDGDVDVPVPPVEVVDTIGAGDSFGGGFLAWWQAVGRQVDDLADPEAIVPAVRAAIQVAGVVVTRRGADPPWRSELPTDWAP